MPRGCLINHLALTPTATHNAMRKCVYIRRARLGHFGVNDGWKGRGFVCTHKNAVHERGKRTSLFSSAGRNNHSYKVQRVVHR